MHNESQIAVNIISLGCAKNLVDAEVMCGTLAINGFCLSSDPEFADLMLINTCSFIADAREEAEESIRYALGWKMEGKRCGVQRVVAVAGCLPQRNLQECQANYPEVDLFIGLDDISNLHKIIEDFYSGKKQAKQSSFPLSSYLYDHQTPRITVTPENYAYIKIAEGCNHRCSFCAIPAIRGDFRSREINSVVEECKQLLQQGVREINFIAQDSSYFGKDNNSSFLELLKNCENLPGDFWLRVLYTHPLHITEEFLELLNEKNKIVPYLDIPLQHISSSVLKNMKRGMDGEATRKLLLNIREKYPEIKIRTTFLTGFPGESEEDFQELLSFVKEMRFERMGAFAFSPEIGTAALDLKEAKVSKTLAIKRRNMLMETQQKISLQQNKKMIGTTVRVLPEQILRGGYFLGRSAADAPEVDQVIEFKALRKRKDDLSFAKVKITAAMPYSLKGVEV